MKIIFFNVLNGHTKMFPIDSYMAKVCNQFGHEVKVVGCNSKLTACLRLKYQRGMTPNQILDATWKNHLKACNLCEQNKSKTENNIDFDFGNFTAPTFENAFLENWNEEYFEGIRIGEHARSLLHRYMAKGNLDYEAAENIAIYRHFLKACAESVIATYGIIEREKPNVAVIHHGIYIPQGVISEVCRKLGIRQVVWNVGYRRGSILLSENDTYHKVIPSFNRAEIESLDLSDIHRKLGKQYVSSRWNGKLDWVRYQNRKSLFVLDHLSRNKLELLILTNVAWDAQVHFEESHFGSQHEWLVTLIKLCSELNIKTKIRVHPAEKLGSHPSRENLVDFINEQISKFSAKNVKVIGPENKISTYRLIDQANAVCVYGSKTALEAAIINKPVIICGDAWVKSKKIAYEPNSINQLRDNLTQIKLGKLNPLPNQVKNAAEFAYILFFGLAPSPRNLRKINNFEEMRQISELGKDELCKDPEILRLVDMICNGAYPRKISSESCVELSSEIETHID